MPLKLFLQTGLKVGKAAMQQLAQRAQPHVKMTLESVLPAYVDRIRHRSELEQKRINVDTSEVQSIVTPKDQEPTHVLGIEENFYNCRGIYVSYDDNEGNTHRYLVHYHSAEDSTESLRTVLEQAKNNADYSTLQSITVLNYLCCSNQVISGPAYMAGIFADRAIKRAFDAFREETGLDFKSGTRFVDQSNFIIGTDGKVHSVTDFERNFARRVLEIGR